MQHDRNNGLPAPAYIVVKDGRVRLSKRRRRPIINRFTAKVAVTKRDLVKLPEHLQQLLNDLEGMRRHDVILPEDDRELTQHLEREAIKFAEGKH